MRPHFCLIVLLTLCFGFIPYTVAQTGPSITGVSPTAAPSGTSVTITGTNFGATRGASTVAFNGAAGTPTSWSNTSIVVPVPWAARTGNVVVTVGGVASNGISFTVVPHIDALSSLFGPVGASVQLSGEGFGPTQGTSTVTFNGTIGTPTYWDNYSITVPVPSGATNGNVVVTVDGLASNGVGFAVTAPSFAIVQSNSSWSYGSTSVQFASSNSAGNLLWVAVGSGTLTPPTDTLGNSYSLAVSVNGVNGFGNAAIYYAASAKAGSNTVTCNGLGLTLCHIVEVAGLASNAPLDQIGSAVSSSVCSVSTSGATTQADEWVAAFIFDTAISQQLTPLGGYSTMQMSYDKPAYTHGALSASAVPAWSGVQTVTCSGNAPSEPLTQLITTFKPQSGGGPVPSITGLSPTSGAVGAAVTISGTSFGATQGASTVKFNGTTATPTSWSDTSIVVPVPSGATTGNVVATINGVATNGISFTVLQTPSITSLSPASGAVGTSVTITGTNFGSTQGSGTVKFNGTTATVMSWSNTSIVAIVPSGATTGNVIVNASGVSTNGASFTVLSTPSITSLSLTSGAVGTLVTITGTNFGSTQGTSMVTFNGTAGAPTSWSTTSIAVPVPSGATTGNAVVTVQGLASNAISFAVIPPPTITASVSPAANPAGWNNTSVTVTFTCKAGGLSVATCPGTQTISTEGTGQIISGTVTDTGGNSATTSVTLNIDKTPPALSVGSPSEGDVESSSALTASGTISDTLSGASSVTCNGALATLSGGSFSCNISLNVGVNLIMLRGTDLAGNVAGLNLHASLTGVLPPPNSLQVSPSSVNILVGDTQQFTAVDERGRPRSDATWTISDTTVATISADSSPLLTAVFVGQATLTATVGSATGQAQVSVLSGTSLPAGTIRWSAPTTPGFTVQSIVQAVPTTAGPELYSVESDGNNALLIRALTADGQQRWVNQFGTNSYGYSDATFMADNNGGIIAKVQTNPNSYIWDFQLTDFDPQTGAQIWSRDFGWDSTTLTQEVAVRGDGMVFKLDTDLIGLDPNTGATVFRYPYPTGTATGSHCALQAPTVSTLSPPTVGPDGTVYSVVTKTDIVFDGCFPAGQEGALSSLTQTLLLLQVATDGTTSLSTLRQDASPQTPMSSFAGQFYLTIAPNPVVSRTVFLVDYYQAIPQAQAYHVIPDGQGGVLVPYTFASVQDFVAVPSYQKRVTHVAAGGGVNDFAPSFEPTQNPQELVLLLGDSSTAYATDGQTVQVFDVASSQALWSYTSQGTDSLAFLLSVVNRGLIGKEFSGGSETVVRFDSAGLPSLDTWSGAKIDYFIGTLWTGIVAGTGAGAYIGPSPQEASGPSTRPGGDPQHNWTADPGLVLVATQDCHKVNAQRTLYARYPIYSLRMPNDRSKTPQEKYTVFEFIPEHRVSCGVGGFGGLNPCSYADGVKLPYNEFADEISTGFVYGAFNVTQYFLYGLPGQRIVGIKQIYRTLSGGSPELKATGWNSLSATPGADPLIDGKPDPWLAPWDGQPSSCNSSGSTYFPN